jgi:hypothetical protein
VRSTAGREPPIGYLGRVNATHTCQSIDPSLRRLAVERTGVKVQAAVLKLHAIKRHGAIGNAAQCIDDIENASARANEASRKVSALPRLPADMLQPPRLRKWRGKLRKRRFQLRAPAGAPRLAQSVAGDPGERGKHAGNCRQSHLDQNPPPLATRDALPIGKQIEAAYAGGERPAASAWQGSPTHARTPRKASPNATAKVGA